LKKLLTSIYNDLSRLRKGPLSFMNDYHLFSTMNVIDVKIIIKTACDCLDW
jgi:hypothetical protein